MAWESQLFPKQRDSGRYVERSVSFNNRNWKLLDYSYAGYRLGEARLGEGLRCNNEIRIKTPGDITDALQKAVNKVSSMPGGGVVSIPAGRFTITRSIGVDANNVAIIGAGSNNTVISVPSSYRPSQTPNEGVFTFGKPATKKSWHQGWPDKGAVLAAVTAPIMEGDKTLRVDTPSKIKTDDWVVVSQYFSPEFSRLHANGHWDSIQGWPQSRSDIDRRSALIYLRRVEEVHGKAVTLDAPIPWHLDPKDNPIRLRSAVSTPDGHSSIALHHNLGIAGMTLTFADQKRGKTHRPQGVGVHFEGVRDGWVYDVKIHNIPRHGIQLEHSARISIAHSAVLDAQDYGNGGYGYAYHILSSQNVLIDQSYAEEIRHGIVPQYPMTSMLVSSRNHIAAARLSDDTHSGLIHGLLLDQPVFSHGGGFQAFMRGKASGGAWETLGSMTIWNLNGDSAIGSWYGGSLLLNPASSGWGMVIGGPGNMRVYEVGKTLADSQQIAVSPQRVFQVAPGQRQAPGPGSRDQNVLYERLYEDGLQPDSLYRAQLKNRIGRLPAAVVTGCGIKPANKAKTSLYTGKGILVFDSDHLGYSAFNGSGCAQGCNRSKGLTGSCDVDATSRNATTGGNESLRARFNGENHCPAVNFRGKAVHKAEVKSLRFSIYPSKPDLSFRIRLAHQILPENQRPEPAGDLILKRRWKTGEWNQVEIPLESFDTGNAGYFNHILFSSTGPQSASEFYLDDFTLEMKR